MPQLASCLCLLAWDWVVRCNRIKIPTSNLNFSNFSVISYICGKKWIIINYRELYITKRVRILLHQLWHFLRKPILTSFLDSLWSVLTMTSWWLFTHLHIYAITHLRNCNKQQHGLRKKSLTNILHFLKNFAGRFLVRGTVWQQQQQQQLEENLSVSVSVRTRQQPIFQSDHW